MQLIAQHDADRLELPRVGRRTVREGVQELDEAEQDLPVAPLQLPLEVCMQRAGLSRQQDVEYSAVTLLNSNLTCSTVAAAFSRRTASATPHQWCRPALHRTGAVLAAAAPPTPSARHNARQQQRYKEGKLVAASATRDAT